MIHAILRLSLAPLGLLLLLAFQGNPEAPRVKALLVGVSDYAHLSDDLDGPTHDVELMARMLVQQFGAVEADLTRLVSQPDSASAANASAEPTRASILAALDAFKLTLDEGDLAVVFMAGHGVSIPDLNGDERDGMDETFLGADADAWDAESKTLPGAITDDELGDKLAELVSTGATVWMIADSCFSGSLHRGDGMRTREISMRSLGIPTPDALAMSASHSERSGFEETRVDAAVRSGKLVIFTAAQRDERAGEKLFSDPLDDAGAQRWYGLFSYFLFGEVMGERGITSFRDLIRRTKIRFDSAGVNGTTPLAIGALDQPIPFLQSRDRAPFVVWNKSGIVLSVGALDGIEPGTEVEVETDPEGTAPSTVRIVVERVRALDSICRLHADHVALSPSEVLGANEPREARLITEVVDGRRVLVWVDPAVKAALRHLGRPKELGEFLWFEEVGERHAAEWTLESAGGGVLLSSTLSPEDRFWTKTRFLDQTFKAIYMVRNLRRLATHPWVGGLPEGLTVRLLRKEYGSQKFLPLAEDTPIRPGDSLKFVVENETDDSWGIHVFAIGPDQSVTDLNPTRVTLAPGEDDFGSIMATDGSLGQNSLLVMASRNPSEDFSMLGCNGLQRFRGEFEEAYRSGTRGDTGPQAKETALMRLMQEVANPSTRSGAKASYEDVEAWVALLPLELDWDGVPSQRPWEGTVTADALAAADRFAAAGWPIDLPEFPKAGWPSAGGRDLVQLGDDEVTGWLLDPAASLRDAKEPPAEGLLERRSFQPAFALVRAPAGWMSAYDTRGDGVFDVVILDEDGDLRGDRRWERGAGESDWGRPYVGALDPLVSLVSWLRAGDGPGSFATDSIDAALDRLSQSVFAGLPLDFSEDSNGLLVGSPSVVTAGPLTGASSPLVAIVESEFSDLCSKVRLLEDAPELPSDLRVEVWNDPALNAVCNGHTIFITLALIEALDRREDQVRAVLAHELAHAILDHGRDRRQLRGAMTEALDVRHHLIRQAEFEADAFAADLLERTGDSPEALYDLLIRLHRVQRSNEVGWIEGVGGDHGSLMERLARLKPTEARARALRAFERGTAFLECRRPDRASEAFEFALGLEDEIPGGLDEVRFALARARLQLYHERLPLGIRDEWLQPDFGPQLTVDDVLASRGAETVPADLARWNAAMDEVMKLTRSVDPETAELLRGTALVLHPAGDGEEPSQGVEALEKLIDSRASLPERRPEVFLAAVNNLALGLDRTGRTAEACDLLLKEADDAFFGMPVFFANTARVAAAARDASARDVALKLLGGVLARAHVDSRAYEAAAASVKQLSMLDASDLLAAPEPSFAQLCVPIGISIGQESLELYGTRRALERVLGAPDSDERVHPSYRAFRALSWLSPGEAAGAKTDLVALSEDGVVVKLTTYRPGSSVTLRAKDGAAQKDEVIAIGQSETRLQELFGEDALQEVKSLNVRLLGRSNERDGVGLGRSDRWLYYPSLSFGVLVERGVISALTLSPVYRDAKGRRRK